MTTQLQTVADKLEKIACLGNGDTHGNSIGNTLAIECLEIVREMMSVEPVSGSMQAAQPVTSHEPPCCKHVKSVRWNSYNGVVQCHSCGTVYEPQSAQPVREPAPQEQIQALLDDFMDSSDERLTQFARDVEKLHRIGDV